MPRTPINYTNTHFYKIVCNDLNIKDCYVGHTTDFKRRKCDHKLNTTSQTSHHYNAKVYTFIRANGGWYNFDMILIDTRSCDNNLEARKIERQYIENLQATLNYQIPTRTSQEHYQDNKEQILEWHREYRNNNKDEIKMKSAEYYIKHKEYITARIKEYQQTHKETMSQYYREYNIRNRDKNSETHVCECGKTCTKCNKPRHERSMFHQRYIQAKSNIEEI